MEQLEFRAGTSGCSIFLTGAFLGKIRNCPRVTVATIHKTFTVCQLLFPYDFTLPTKIAGMTTACSADEGGRFRELTYVHEVTAYECSHGGALLPRAVATGHRWLLGTASGPSVTKGVNFKFYLALTNLRLI